METIRTTTLLRSGNLKRNAVTQTPEKKHQLTLIEKKRKLLLSLLTDNLIPTSQKRRFCRQVDFAVPANNKLKRKRKKYIHFARDLKKKKQWNMIRIVNGTFVIEPKGLAAKSARAVEYADSIIAEG